MDSQLEKTTTAAEQPSWRECIGPSFRAAIPIMLGYAAIGLPCGILSDSIGLNVLQVLLLSVLFYSGAGQFMIPNMYLAGNPIIAIITSVSLVNTRQMLYSASLAPRCENTSKPLAFFFSATVTDESFGVNNAEFELQDGSDDIPGTDPEFRERSEPGQRSADNPSAWSVRNGLLVNLFSQASWTLFNIIGVLIGSLVDIPLSIAAFAMTSIFICLLVTQPVSIQNVASAVIAIIGVFVCKLIGLSGPAILIGALVGVAGGLVVDAFVWQRRTGNGLG